MPTTLLHHDLGLDWLQTVVHRTSNGIETELHFDIDGRELIVFVESVPETDFLRKACKAEGLSVVEFSSQERGWVENGRYEIQLLDEDGIIAKSAANRMEWVPA